MVEIRYQDLSSDSKRDALEVAERAGGQMAHLLEKDVWVVAILSVLFGAPFAGHLTFRWHITVEGVACDTPLL